MLLCLMYLQMKMVLFMTRLLMLLLMATRLMGHPNLCDDSHSISSVMKSTIFTCSNFKHSLSRHLMSCISISRWALTQQPLSHAMLTIFICSNSKHRSILWSNLVSHMPQLLLRRLCALLTLLLLCMWLQVPDVPAVSSVPHVPRVLDVQRPTCNGRRTCPVIPRCGPCLRRGGFGRNVATKQLVVFCELFPGFWRSKLTKACLFFLELKGAHCGNGILMEASGRHDRLPCLRSCDFCM